MAKFDYWMVYLPEVQPESFLLFVCNPTGSNKLRDYSSGGEREVGQPGSEEVFRKTRELATRFKCEPHTVTDALYWHAATRKCNRDHLNLSRTRVSASVLPALVSSTPTRRIVEGRAIKGSRRQLQDYVNLRPDALTRLIVRQLTPASRFADRQIRWVSPLATDNYREYRDDEFLGVLGLSDCVRELSRFWPKNGPSWDALGILDCAAGPEIILVEAKSHIPEMFSKGCMATPRPRAMISSALEEARRWCGAASDADWLGSLYQSANRLAHLYFLRERMGVSAWLVNLYFIDDPYRPTSRAEWGTAWASAKSDLGLTLGLENAVDVCVPAFKAPLPGQGVASSFAIWSERWLSLARFEGPHLPDPSDRIERVLRLWDEPVPGGWERGLDLQLLDTRYRRGDIDSPRSGEHAIEHEILHQHFGTVRCMGGSLVDGVNAMPFVRDARGGRRGNVEADMLLLLKMEEAYNLIVAEVKYSANDAWYAVVENLRQLKLLKHSATARAVFHHRNPTLALTPELPTVGMVVAPVSYYSQPGRKADAVAPAKRLLQTFTARTHVAAHLAIWDTTSRTIELMR